MNKTEKLLREFINEVMDGFGNKNLGRDGIGGNLRYDVPLTALRGGNILDDEASQEAKIKKAACCLIFHPDGKRILAVSRRDDPTDFGLPGGKVDEPETPEEAAKRELKEETGLDAMSLSLVFVRADEGSYKTYTYLTKAAGEFGTDESGVVKWVTPDDLMNGSFGEYNMRLFQKLGLA